MKFAECHDYYLGQPLVVDYVVCEDCGLIQQTPVPQDVLPLYEEYPVHEARSGLLDRIGRLLMQQVYHDTLADPVGSSILDYGCGSGAYLASLKGKAFDLCGFELDAAQAMSVSARLGVPVYSDGVR